MAVVRQDRLYIPAARSTTSIVNSMLSWSVGESGWNSSLVRLNTARNSYYTVYCSNSMFVLRSFDGRYLSTVELYDFIENTWVTKSSMIQSLYGMGCLCYKQRYILVSGEAGSGGKRSNHVYIYNINTDTFY